MTKSSVPQKGKILFALVFIILAIGIIAYFAKNQGLTEAEKSQAQIDGSVAKIKSGMKQFLAQNGRFPLRALELIEPDGKSGPYLEPDELKDPWNTEWQFQLLGSGDCELLSAGKDRTFGSGDDIALLISGTGL